MGKIFCLILFFFFIVKSASSKPQSLFNGTLDIKAGKASLLTIRLTFIAHHLNTFKIPQRNRSASKFLKLISKMSLKNCRLQELKKMFFAIFQKVSLFLVLWRLALLSQNFEKCLHSVKYFLFLF
jgi:hypothetical protein